MPGLAAHVWEWFTDLHAARTGPIAYSEIEAYCRMTGTEMARWEIAAIKRVDTLYLKSNA